MISIVTITYNNHSELITTLASVDSVADTENVVINGGTCEETKEFLKSFKGNSISEPDDGIADAFNKGIKLSKGEYIVFLNSGDELLDPTYYRHAQEYFKGNPEVSFIYSDVVIAHPTFGHMHYKPKNLKGISSMPFSHQTLIMKKEIFENVGNFNVNYRFCMDFELLLRAIISGSKGYYYPHATTIMDGGGVSAKQRFNVQIEEYKALKKHGLLGFFQSLSLVYRFLKYMVKNVLLRTGFFKLVNWYLKYKYKDRVITPKK
ncbi:MAG: glycosyltransferase [Bacteriovoracaceae bacterium]|jgi:GT2 family glycosyltransferase|nr:glycosyltransferase [Bacteriovoracaceae bacterium]